MWDYMINLKLDVIRRILAAMLASKTISLQYFVPQPQRNSSPSTEQFLVRFFTFARK